MTKREMDDALSLWTRRLNKAIDKLNKMDHALVFEIDEDEYSIGFKCHAKHDANVSYGSYMASNFFEDYKKNGKLNALREAALKAEMLIAGAKLCDPKAYHNFIAQ